MTNLSLKNIVAIGFTSFLLLLTVQASFLFVDQQQTYSLVFLIASVLLFTIGFLTTFYVTRQLQLRENVCHIESAKAQSAVDKLEWQATHDSLTGLINRREFRRRVMRVCSHAKRNQSHHVLAMINLDRFKTVNDHCGHRAGDTLLSQLPSVLAPLISDKDTLARISGDEFAILLPNTDIQFGQEIAETLRKAIQEYRFCWNERFYEVGASIGVVPINQDHYHLQEVLTAADTACYQAKTSGRNRVCVLESSDQVLTEQQGRVRCAQELPRAIRDNRLELHAQEIRSLSGDHQGRHYELLVRMNHENGSLVQPDHFIPVAEQYGLAVDLDRWVVCEALSWLSAQSRSITSCSLGKMCDCFCRVSINLSGQSISDPGFLDEIKANFEKSRVNPKQVVFEITETAAIINLSSARHFMRELKAIGCEFALDDFGSGMSSFGYLQELDVDYVKIDGSLVTQIAKGGLENAMINAIVHVAKHMNAQTIAEYVEDRLTQKVLETSGVDFVQGFLIHKPTPLKNLRFCADEMSETQQMALAV